MKAARRAAKKKAGQRAESREVLKARVERAKARVKGIEALIKLEEAAQARRIEELEAKLQKDKAELELAGSALAKAYAATRKRVEQEGLDTVVAAHGERGLDQGSVLRALDVEYWSRQPVLKQGPTHTLVYDDGVYRVRISRKKLRDYDGDETAWRSDSVTIERRSGGRWRLDSLWRRLKNHARAARRD